jgi:glycosyltransferase involved in cell wall biosynthesis
VIGDGEERQALEDHATDLNIADKVEFIGIIPFADIPGYLKAADLFCFASLTETQGLVTMEAMAAGLPVVAVDASGTRDVVEDGAQGFLTLNDPEALARAIEHMVRDKALRERCRASAWKKAQTFEMKHQAEKLVEVYHQAIADKQAGRLVSPDNQKEVFQVIDETQWSRFFASKS